VNQFTNLSATSLPPYLQQARIQGFTLIHLAVTLFRLLAVFAVPRCLDKAGTTHADQATRHPS
jgi:hypothetical protein